MTPKHEAMAIQKPRRLFYELATNEVMGLASGGGALETLTGDAFLIATFNDPDAANKYAVVEEYYNPIPVQKPIKINLGMGDALVKASSEAKNADPQDRSAKLQILMERLDDSIEYEVVVII